MDEQRPDGRGWRTLEEGYRLLAEDAEATREALEWSEALIGDAFADETEDERQANDAWYEEWRSKRLDGDPRRR
ncbi:MAG: hypothetical protein WD557_15045 [Dehalococcoidia bacterium]